MKDGLICGIVIGMIAGALLYKYNPEAKQLVNKTENAVQKQLKSLQKSETKQEKS